MTDNGLCSSPVAVQLTSIVPLRVFSTSGEYFDTEMDLSSPVELLQLAIEDFFKVKPAAQILLYNRQQINPKLSLRDNGCLLLKGDPFVKIVFQLKRGPLLNLVCQLSTTHEEFPIACDEQMTVWEVKLALSHEIDRKRRSFPTINPDGSALRNVGVAPEKMRLLWRYMELNDKASLLYYRIPTNASLYVMIKRGSLETPASMNKVKPTAPKSISRVNNAQPLYSGATVSPNVQVAHNLRLPRQHVGGSLSVLPSLPVVSPSHSQQAHAPYSASVNADTTVAQMHGSGGDTAQLVRFLQEKVSLVEAELSELKHQQSSQPHCHVPSQLLTSQHATYTLQRIQELEQSVKRLYELLERTLSFM